MSAKFTSRKSLKNAPAQFISVSNRTLHLNLSDNGNVSIYSLKGAKLRSFDLTSGSHSLSMTNLPRGMYVVKAVSGSWKQSVRMTVR
jgi:hypothetical protein